MDTPALLAFLAVATALIVLPGPDWAFVVAQGSGRDAVLPAVAGLTSGYVVITTLVALGLGRLVAEVPVTLVLLSVVGGGYLVAVGIGALPSDQTLHLPSGSSHRRGAALWWRGLGVSALNPKSLLFFVAFLPQFARTSAPWPMTVQLGTLGAIWALLAGCFYAALGLGTQRVLALRPEVSRLVARIAGGAMVVAGGLLLADQVVR